MSDAVTFVLDGSVFSSPGGFYGESDSSRFNFTLLQPQEQGSLSLSFTGISIAFIGGTLNNVSRNETSFGVSIRDSSSFFIAWRTSYVQTFSAETRFQWFTSPQLPDSSGSYNIFLSNLDQVGVDYVLIEAGHNTNLTGQTILVDDANPEIIWTGQWTNQTQFNVPDHSVVPNGNGTHTSTSVGSSFEFPFSGSSVVVGGIISLGSSDSLTVNFTVDDSVTPRTFDTSNLLVAQEYYFIWFNSSSLSAGPHVLTANITQVSGQAAFAVDYLMYEPSFQFLRDKPSFSSSPTTNTMSSTGIPPTQTSVLSSQHPSAGTPAVGAIVGGVVGGVVLLVVVLGAFFLYRQHRRNNHRPIVNLDNGYSVYHDSPSLRPHQPHLHLEPLVISPSYQPPPPTKSLTFSNASSSELSRQATLRRHVEELSALEREMTRQTGAAQSSGSVSESIGPSSSSGATRDQIADIQARIAQLTMLMNEYVVPPAYEVDRPGAEAGVTIPWMQHNADPYHDPSAGVESRHSTHVAPEKFVLTENR